jgi:hypothetical protein
MLSQLSLRLAINGAGNFAAVESQPPRSQGASAFAKVNAGHAIEKTPAKWRTPVSPSWRLK